MKGADVSTPSPSQANMVGQPWEWNQLPSFSMMLWDVGGLRKRKYTEYPER